jgi:acetylornithine deacetylase/succinyl-diaminopimelate desuccinylase-like protein
MTIIRALTLVASGFGRTVGLLVLSSLAAAAQPVPPRDLIDRDPALSAAVAAARAREARTIEDQVRFCEVPAPPFEETARAEVLRRAFVDAGLERVRLDGAGNVLGDRPGTTPRPRLVIAAHLDTVFPEGTDVTVRRSGTTLHGPGIGDNCRGLAVLVAVANTLRQASVTTRGSVTFVANVGEEGLGDLRGVKALFHETLKGQIDRFVSIDGSGIHVTNIGVGSLRYRMTFKGPGGHSFASFGLANPIGALGRAVARINELRVPSDPRTTFNVGRIGGGTSVNSIPFEAWMEIDIRSPDRAALAALDSRVQDAIDAAVRDENARWGKPGTITAERELVGDRPAGSTPAGSPIVQAAQGVARLLGLQAPLGQGSTDSNLPMSLGIPAITIGGGGRGTGAHALDEAFESTGSWQGTANAVLLAVALSQP